jgi:hypothetical protein
MMFWLVTVFKLYRNNIKMTDVSRNDSFVYIKLLESQVLAT